MESKANQPMQQEQPKKYFFREKNGTITYIETQEEMFALLRSPKGNNFRDMGKTEYLNLHEQTGL